ncbi:MAG: dihydroxyacetone kinase family protein, partial [Protaetiibacter sp.]
MTLIHNDPRAFAAEMLEGFVAAHGDRIRAVPGGVLALRRRPDAVAVVTGGGSGHYPAFAGYVGPGLAAGAVAGDVFASPSAQQVLSVARRADTGAGVLLCYGNYAGDVLNFDLAEERLRSEGIDCRTVVVTDDIASAPAAERERRRGVAGDLAVMKIAGAAADAGWDLDRVAEVARRANARTRSLGVAFGGCTLPGEAAPLFSVPPGRMAVGLGIHGEPGLEETAIPAADGLAELLVDRLLAEAPAGAGPRVGVTLNGLGSVTSEELYLLYRSVARRLRTAGLQPVAPLVGDFCTSFDMAGVSLTLVWLDDELEALLTAPCDTPALRVGEAAAGLLEPVAEPVEEQTGIPRGGAASAALAARVAEVAEGVAAAVDAAAEELGRLDAVAGD